jgi:hypothetical protein
MLPMLPQGALGGVGGHHELGRGEESVLDLFHPQFHLKVHLEGLSAIVSWEGETRLGWTGFVSSFTTGCSWRGWRSSKVLKGVGDTAHCLLGSVSERFGK